MRWIQLAAYRIWRLRRVIAIELLAPWAAIWLTGLWEPSFAAILPMLIESGAHVEYAMFILAAAVLFPTGAIAGLVLVGAFTFAIFFMPAIWRLSTSGGPVDGAFLESALLVTALAWGLAHLSIRALQSVAWPREYRSAATIRIAQPAPEVYEALRLGETDAPLNEVIERVSTDPDRPGSFHVHYPGGVKITTHIVHKGGMAETSVTEMGRVREVYSLAVAPDGVGARMTETSRTTGYPFPNAVGAWLKDFLRDRQVYFRDRLEGRQSLAVHATVVRSLKRKGLLQRLFGRSKQ